MKHLQSKMLMTRQDQWQALRLMAEPGKVLPMIEKANLYNEFGNIKLPSISSNYHILLIAKMK